MLQPMFQVKLTGSGADIKAELVKTLVPEDTTPPEVAFKG
jgi:branched-chain amino acid transport system substrate-binding protein